MLTERNTEHTRETHTSAFDREKRVCVFVHVCVLCADDAAFRAQNLPIGLLSLQIRETLSPPYGRVSPRSGATLKDVPPPLPPWAPHAAPPSPHLEVGQNLH